VTGRALEPISMRIGLMFRTTSLALGIVAKFLPETKMTPRKSLQILGAFAECPAVTQGSPWIRFDRFRLPT
jgi:hypothetical protein